MDDENRKSQSMSEGEQARTTIPQISELNYKWILPLLGAIGFGIGFATSCALSSTVFNLAKNAFANIPGLSSVSPVVGLLKGLTLGSIGGAALGLGFKDKIQVVYFSLASAIGFAIAFALILAINPRTPSVGLIIGALGGLSLGIAAPKGRFVAAFLLGLAGAIWFAFAFSYEADHYTGSCSAWNGWAGALGGAIFGLVLSWHKYTFDRIEN